MNAKPIVIALSGMFLLSSSTKKTETPNLVFIFSDQQTFDLLGCFGNKQIKTPNPDRLVRKGILYNQATCQAPLCTPSRNSLMLGLYPSQLGIRSNGSHALGDSSLPCDTLPARLQKAGYQAAGFGKTHWGNTDQPIGTRGFETRVVGAKEVGLEIGAIHYQDDENPEGLAAYGKEVASYQVGEEGVVSGYHVIS